MHRLFGGYAINFNRRHERAGHLFQNRFKSILCEEEAYFVTLVRYIHSNPLRAGIVSTVEELDRYPWTGHSAIVGYHPRPWQNVRFVLETIGGGITEYRSLIGESLPVGLDLSGGGLRRSREGFDLVGSLRCGREAFRSDERILGRRAFVDRVSAKFRKEVERLSGDERIDLEALIDLVSDHLGTRPDQIRDGGRPRLQSRCRAGVAYLWLDTLGGSAGSLAIRLGLSASAVYAARTRGRKTAEKWNKLLRSRPPEIGIGNENRPAGK